MKKILSLALAGTLALSLASCSKTKTEPVMDTTITVETAVARTGDLTAESTYIGTISSEGTANVIALVSGTVEKVNVSVGDSVTAGQALCSFDDTAAQLTLSTAQAAVATAQAGQASAAAGQASAAAGMEQTQAAVHSAQESYRGALAQYGANGEDDSLPVIESQVRLAEENYENTKALFEIGAASQIEVDQAYQAMTSAQAGLQAARASLNAAQAGVQQAQASISTAQAGAQQAAAGAQSAAAGVRQAQTAVESAKYQLSLYHLTAPISGVVEAINVSENNFAPSGTAAFVISNGNNKTVTFYVTDQVRRTLRLGQSVTVAAGERSYTGVVTEISGVVDVTAGQFKIKAVIDSAVDLPDGLVVELTTVAYAADQTILVPSDALYFENGATYVYVLQGDSVRRVEVAVDLTTAETAAITDGISAGDTVVTSWSSSLRDGAAVRVAGPAEG